MRIAYIVGDWPKPSETFLHREVEALRRLGVGVDVFPLWPQRRDLRPDPTVHRASKLAVRAQIQFLVPYVRWQFRLLGAWRREGWAALRAFANLNPAIDIARQAEALGIDRVHAQFGSLPSTVGWIAASVARLPFSFAVHARDVFVEAQFLAEKARAADHILACNSAAADRLLEQVAPDDAEKIDLIPHGLPLDAYPLRDTAPAGPPLVLAVGRFVEKKGFPVLLQAMARLRQQRRDVRCWLVGDGPARAELEREIASLGIGDAVVLKGWLSPEAVLDAYRQAAVVVAPSIIAEDGDRDGLPNVLLEAAAVGVPLVATDVGGIRDLLVEGETGLVARAADAGHLADRIGEVIDHPDAAAARRRQARTEVETRFDAEQNARRLAEALT